MRSPLPAALAVLTTLVVHPEPALAAGLAVTVRDAGGAHLADAVVSIVGADCCAPASPDAPVAVMDQRDREFVPHVLAVHAGTAVSFPNSDDIRHHVYSFSETQRFEIRLYSGTPSMPIDFMDHGVVVLGCNIHDWMLGYVYVSESPVFVKTDASGSADFDALAGGDYEVRVWHPNLAEDGPLTRNVALHGSEMATLEFAVPSPPAADAVPSRGDPLSERFRRFRNDAD